MASGVKDVDVDGWVLLSCADTGVREFMPSVVNDAKGEALDNDRPRSYLQHRHQLELVLRLISDPVNRSMESISHETMGIMATFLLSLVDVLVLGVLGTVMLGIVAGYSKGDDHAPSTDSRVWELHVVNEDFYHHVVYWLIFAIILIYLQGVYRAVEYADLHRLRLLSILFAGFLGFLGFLWFLGLRRTLVNLVRGFGRDDHEVLLVCWLTWVFLSPLIMFWTIVGLYTSMRSAVDEHKRDCVWRVFGFICALVVSRIILKGDDRATFVRDWLLRTFLTSETLIWSTITSYTSLSKGREKVTPLKIQKLARG